MKTSFVLGLSLIIFGLATRIEGEALLRAIMFLLGVLGGMTLGVATVLYSQPKPKSTQLPTAQIVVEAPSLPALPLQSSRLLVDKRYPLVPESDEWLEDYQ